MPQANSPYNPSLKHREGCNGSAKPWDEFGKDHLLSNSLALRNISYDFKMHKNSLKIKDIKTEASSGVITP